MVDRLRQLLGTPNQFSSYELHQRQGTLSKIIWVVIAVSIALAGVNFVVDDPITGALILVLVLTSFFALYLNRKGHYLIAGVILCALILFITNWDIYGAGGIISDAGVGAFPIVIIICSLLFGKRGLWTITALSVLSIAALGILDLTGLMPGSSHYTDFSDVVVVIILTTGTAFLVWVIMHNAEKNLQRIKNDDKMLRVSFEITLEGLAKALEYRDRETKNHSSRVVEMSVRLARAAGLQDEDLLNIKRGALLHDIGKLAIPDSILQKPGPLTAEEWAVMKTHPVKAMEILETIPFLKPAMNIPFCHHENWDGTGYPRGLKGEEIPLFARIFTIIDQWEALTDDRVYRKAWPYEKVIQYIKDNSGRLYDPRIVEIFLHLVKTDPGGFDSSHIDGPIPVDLISIPFPFQCMNLVRLRRKRSALTPCAAVRSWPKFSLHLWITRVFLWKNR